MLENYLRLAEDNLPLNQLYVDLNNDEQVNVKSNKEAESEAMSTAKVILKNIEGSPFRKDQINLMLNTDPFCNYKKVVNLLMKELKKDE